MKNARVATFSDIHLGHKANDTMSILKMLDNEIFTKKLLDKIDILFFAGDLFDRLLQLDYPALPEMDAWFAKLLAACEHKGLIFRVLEGTPSHDRGQPQRLQTIYEIIGCKADFQYIDVLKIEYIEKFDLNVLYIPDEWKNDNSDTLAEVKDLMNSRGLKQVDIAIMHGQFEYQIPIKGKNIPVHDANEYEKLVKVIIFIGHVHTHSRSGKIVAQGSLDRLRHGEEEPKGYVWADIKNNHADVYFIENKLARIYKTIQVYGLDISQTALRIEKALTGVPPDTCLRIEAEPQNPIFANFHQLESMYPTITFSKLPKEDGQESEEQMLAQNEFTKWVKVEITPDNLVELVMERLPDDLNQSDRDYIQEQLMELL